MATQQANGQSFSFEFFPPKTERGIKKLQDTRAELSKLDPLFFSVTFGAGGSTRDHTAETVIDIQTNDSVNAAPHLSCIDSTPASIRNHVSRYIDNDIKRIVALRGDIPSGSVEIGEYRYANELVEFIRQETGDHFHIEVAAYPEVHPQARSAQADIIRFKGKIDAGANSAITQYFYNADAYFRFIDDCEKHKIDAPIVPGIMPITNSVQLIRFSDACGAEIPRWIRHRLDGYGDDLDSIRAFGVDVVTALCDRLLAAGAPGLHFYTLNQSAPSLAIWNNLGLCD